MTPGEMALAFAFLGGVLVAMGTLALSGFLRDRFRLFEERSAIAAEDRREALGLLHDLEIEAARATKWASETAMMQRIEHESRAGMTQIAAERARRARILRLRAARARGERHPTWPHSHLGPRR